MDQSPIALKLIPNNYQAEFFQLANLRINKQVKNIRLNNIFLQITALVTNKFQLSVDNVLGRAFANRRLGSRYSLNSEIYQVVLKLAVNRASKNSSCEFRSVRHIRRNAETIYVAFRTETNKLIRDYLGVKIHSCCLIEDQLEFNRKVTAGFRTAG